MKFLLTFLFSLITLSYQSQYTLEDLEGKVISLYNVKTKTWLQYDGSSTSTHPYDDPYKNSRFEVVRHNQGGEFYLKSKKTNNEVGRSGGSSSKVSSNTRFEESFVLDYLKGDYVFWTNYTNFYLCALPDQGTDIWIYGSYVFDRDGYNDQYKRWEILINECENGQVYDSAGGCVSDCGDQKFKGDYACGNCPNECQKCTSATYCTTCWNRYVYENDVCVDEDLYVGAVAFKDKRDSDRYCRATSSKVKCDSKSIGTDEKFTIFRVNGGELAIKSNDRNKYCSNYETVKCDKSSVTGSSERWKAYKNADGTYSFKSQKDGKYLKSSKKNEKYKYWRVVSDSVQNDEQKFSLVHI